jgi:hypothetical protein
MNCLCTFDALFDKILEKFNFLIISKLFDLFVPIIAKHL